MTIGSNLSLRITLILLFGFVALNLMVIALTTLPSRASRSTTIDRISRSSSTTAMQIWSMAARMPRRMAMGKRAAGPCYTLLLFVT